MKISIRKKVTAAIAATVLLVSAVSTYLSISVQQQEIEQEVAARGMALTDALARSVSEDLAAERLNLIKSVAEIVQTDDVLLTQVYTTLWLSVASVPVERLNDPPRIDAREYYKTHGAEHDHLILRENGSLDIYHPIFLDVRDRRIKNFLIGYVRLKISRAAVQEAMRSAVVSNVLASLVLTLMAVLLLDLLIDRTVLRPLMNLHRSISLHRGGGLPEAVPVTSNDEIGELTSEYNQMGIALREREDRIAEEKERLVVTLRSIGDSVIVTDTQGTITLINKVAEQTTGWTAQEAVGRHLGEVFSIISERTREKCEDPVENVLKNGIVVGLANHTALIRRDGSEVVIEDSAAPIQDRQSRTIGVVLVFRDVTEKKRIEQELLKAEKLQSVGVLAGGLAHDFNNLLTSIVGNISMAKMFVEAGSKAHQRLDDAESASRRATELTQQLLTFSRGGAPVRKAASIVDLIRESARFTLAGTPVAPEFAINGDIWPVDIDAGQMSQVFNNLIINAVQAMPQGGSIRFTVVNAVLAGQEVPTLHEGAYVKVSIQDTGTGIPAQHLTMVFDPYFTTKQKGSGLGLASVYSIVKNHDGYILVESAPGRGATFHLYLPALPQAQVSAPAGMNGLVAGHGRILVMDDEQAVRDVAGAMLKELGYEAAFVENGDEAIAAYRAAMAEGRRFDAVIMDLTIPGGMGGKDAIMHLRAVDPGVKAIVSSGYSNDPIMAEHAKHGFRGVIIKPYDIRALSATLSEVTAGDPGRTNG